MHSQTRRRAAATVPAKTMSTTPAATACTAPPSPTIARRDSPHLDSLVWAQCIGYPFWPGRVVDVTTAGVRVDFFGEDTMHSFTHAASLVPFRHERSDEFLRAGCVQRDQHLRVKFVNAYASAVAATATAATATAMVAVSTDQHDEQCHALRRSHRRRSPAAAATSAAAVPTRLLVTPASSTHRAYGGFNGDCAWP